MTVHQLPLVKTISTKNWEWDHTRDLSHAEGALRLGPIVSLCDMRDYLKSKGKIANFSSEIYCGYLEDGTKCVVKPKSGDQILIAQVEELAYNIYESQIALRTGNHFIPPTVVRKLPDGTTASCQYFVETGAGEDMWQAEFFEKTFQQANPEDVNELSVFNSVFGNWDRHPGSLLATERKGRMHLASLHNSGIEAHTFIRKWGRHPYVAVGYTADLKASRADGVVVPLQTGTAEEIGEKTKSYGFDIQRDAINQVIESKTLDIPKVDDLVVNKGRVMVDYYKGSNYVFPLPKGPYSDTLIETYRRLDKWALLMLFDPLDKLNHTHFGDSVDGIMKRRDMFLEAALNEKLSHEQKNGYNQP